MRWMIKDKTLSNYLTACRFAELQTFKQDRRLQKIFEHCTEEAAKNYLKIIGPHLINNDFTNDNYGSPDIHIGYRFSFSTLQYIAVVKMLVDNFGSLNDLRIVEIGGGYGGQCRTIMDIYRPSQYHIIDLPEPCELQRRYCEAECFTEPTGKKYDLCISNYALSEIIDNKPYIDEVLRRSKHGYITCNTDFVTLPWEHKRIPDISGEPNNFILIW